MSSHFSKICHIPVSANLALRKPPGLMAYQLNYFLKSCSKIAQPIADLIDFSIATSQFPDRLKQANGVPVFKKKDPLDKRSYRPVSILPSISKIFEKTINDQLSAHSENIFNPFLGAFRPGMSYQSTLLCLVEDWRQALDRHEYAAAILMDLSKAFDCLPMACCWVSCMHMGSPLVRVLWSAAT